jgi:molybdopterin-guanine dinucleotide biosynthesis protein A
MSRPAALILAGGEGNRLGSVRKATLKFGGQRLLDRIGAVLAPHCAPIFVSTGPVGRASASLPPEMIDVADLDLPIGGPLAGVIALAHWLETASAPPDLVVTVAVDTPLLPHDFVPVLMERLPASAPTAYVTHGENFYPTNAIWRGAALAELSARTASGTPPKSLRAVLEDIGAAAISWPSTAASADPFANINTLADLIALTRRAREEIGVASRPIRENRT